MGEEFDHLVNPLIELPLSLTPQIKRTGTLRTAIAHVITAVLGSGVLSLSWSIAHLGWIGGPLAMVAFAGITLVQSSLLCDCYKSPDPVHGPIRNPTYMEAVRFYLGKRSVWCCGFLQQFCLIGAGIAYTITSSDCMRAIQRSSCHPKKGHQAECLYGDSSFMLLFGGVQIVFSQIPDLSGMEWLSTMSAMMSFCYSSIGIALGIISVIVNGKIKGSISGIPQRTATEKLWKVAQALGDIAFAYPFSIVLVQIQDTLKSPPPENQTMKRASMISIFITTFFYLFCGGFGYAAFGDDTPGNLLTGFSFDGFHWLSNIANACIVLHLVGGYQLYSQPLFACAEKWVLQRHLNSSFVNQLYAVEAPLLGVFNVNLFRLFFRTTYVISTTGIAIFFPYFNQVLGLLGASTIWPIDIYFPVKMYFVQKKIGAWTRKWVILQSYSLAGLIIAAVALVGCLQGLISAKFSVS